MKFKSYDFEVELLHDLLHNKINVFGHCIIDYDRGRKLLLQREVVPIKELLMDIKDCNSIVDSLPDIVARITRFERTESQFTWQIWFKS